MTASRRAVMVAARTLAGLLLAAGALLIVAAPEAALDLIGAAALVVGVTLYMLPVCSSWQSKPETDQQ